MPIKRQSSTNPSHSDANPVPIRCQTNSNPSQLPKSTQCRSKSIAYQMPVPPKGNILPIPYQSANCMSILSLSPNPMPICQHIHPLTIQRIVIPIHCRSANPSKSIDPLPVNKVINISPINCQSHTNSISICKSVNPRPIGQSNVNIYESTNLSIPLILCHKEHIRIPTLLTPIRGNGLTLVRHALTQITPIFHQLEDSCTCDLRTSVL